MKFWYRMKFEHNKTASLYYRQGTQEAGVLVGAAVKLNKKMRDTERTLDATCVKLELTPVKGSELLKKGDTSHSVTPAKQECTIHTWATRVTTPVTKLFKVD